MGQAVPWEYCRDRPPMASLIKTSIGIRGSLILPSTLGME